MSLFCFHLQSFDICGRVSAIRKALVMLCSSQVRVECSPSTQEYDDISCKKISNGTIFLFHSELWSEGRQSAAQRGRWHLRNLSGWFQGPHSPSLSGKNEPKRLYKNLIYLKNKTQQQHSIILLPSMFTFLKSGCFLYEPMRTKESSVIKNHYCKIIHYKQGLKLLLKNQRFWTLGS